MSAPAVPSTPAFRPVRFWLLIGSLCLVILAGSYCLHLEMSAVGSKAAPLPVLVHIDQDCEALESTGAPIHLSSLRGKVCVIANIYTVCPHGCATVIGEMAKLFKSYGGRKDFQLVSISVAPDHDTAAFLRSFGEGIGVKAGDPWWFLTGDRGKLTGFMTQELKLEPPRPIPENQRLNPLDLYEHDSRIVLVDRKGNVRGYYSVFHPQPEIAQVYAERLPRDVQWVLQHPEE